VDSGGRLVAGVDVGGVVSGTVVYLCEIAKGNAKILKFGAWRGDDTRGHAVAFLKPYRDGLATVRVDADGTGYNFGAGSARPGSASRSRPRRNSGREQA
jgi:hypothetical protein